MDLVGKVRTMGAYTSRNRSYDVLTVHPSSLM